MIVEQPLCISILLVLCQILYEAAAQQCGRQNGETSMFGMMLRRHVFKRIPGASLGDVCLHECYNDVRCQSFNYVISQHMCELNNRTKEARPENFLPDANGYYFRRDWNRVPLGSIPELPAETCKEIKASEGEQAVSGKHWFDSIIPGQSVLAYCDMRIEDVDECSASNLVCVVNASCRNVPGSFVCSCKSGFTGDGKTCADIDECTALNGVCNANANCENIVGSYVCFCKAGFTGDGKKCTDIDECISGDHNCLSATATCTNTVGSFTCSCNNGYLGDGTTSCVPAECQNYQSLTNGERKSTYSGSLVTCDYDALTPGWYRFQGAAGTKMASVCVPVYYCGTHAPGWLNGVHPTVAEGQVTRQVCFNYFSNCCQWSINVYVRNCGEYFVYYINRTPPEHTCHLRYCGAD